MYDQHQYHKQEKPAQEQGPVALSICDSKVMRIDSSQYNDLLHSQ
jgi:hypothetical protein